MESEASAFSVFGANSAPPEPVTRQSESIPAPLFSVRVYRQRQHASTGSLGYPHELLALSTAAITW